MLKTNKRFGLSESTYQNKADKNLFDFFVHTMKVFIQRTWFVSVGLYAARMACG